MTSYAKHPIGTLVKFPRRGRDNRGKGKAWEDEGVIKRVEVLSYVIRNHQGEMFVRSFHEVERVQVKGNPE